MKDPVKLMRESLYTVHVLHLVSIRIIIQTINMDEKRQDQDYRRYYDQHIILPVIVHYYT